MNEKPFKSKFNILIKDPAWDDVACQTWSRGVGLVAGTINMLTLFDPEFARRVREQHTLSSDVQINAFQISEEFTIRTGPALIPAHTHLAETFSILEPCGFFKYHRPYYEFALPEVVLPDTVRSAVYRLLETENLRTGTCHPEKIVKCSRLQHLPPELSKLEKSRLSFIYRPLGGTGPSTGSS